MKTTPEVKRLIDNFVKKVGTTEHQCNCIAGPEWSGSPHPEHPDTQWICDGCGKTIDAVEKQQKEFDSAMAGNTDE